jgi:hypothetical protein
VAGDDEFVEVGGGGGVHGLEREVIDDQQLDLSESSHLCFGAVVESGCFEPLEHRVATKHQGGDAAADRDVTERSGQVRLAHPDSEGDRLQQLRAVLPCEVRVVAETHPLFGRLLAAKSFKRWNGVLLLVIDLPDGSPGTIRCDATDVLGVVEPGLRSVLDGAGLRALHRLVGQLATRAEVGVSGVGAQVGSPRP